MLNSDNEPDTEETKETKGPFGNSEGSREDFDRFLDIHLPGAPDGVRLNPNDLTTRVIAGRKGSGKTFYLRRLEAASRDKPSYVVFDQSRSLPSTDNVVLFTGLFPEEQRTDMWTIFWRRMIFRSLMSLFFAEHLRPNGLSLALPGSMTPDDFRKGFIPTWPGPNSRVTCRHLRIS